MSGYVSRLPAIVDRLVDEASGCVDLDQVLDGPILGEVLDNFLVIGFTRSANQPGYASAIRRQEGAGRARLVEAFEVRCLMSVSSGDTDLQTMRGLRSRCGAAMATLDEHLRDLGAVAGVWDRCGLTGDTDWVPLQDPDGAIVNVTFTIEGTVLL